MTRAGCYALAFVVGVCCLGRTQAFAQNEPAPPPGSGPVYPNQPFDPSAPDCPDPWYGADDVEPSINMVGPKVKVNSWFLRADYLNWNIGRPGNALLGAPVYGNFVNDPSKPFLMFAPNTAGVIGYGYVPNLSGITLTDNSGVQVTAGVDLIDGGQFEVSGFMLARKQSGYNIPLSTFGLVDITQLLFLQTGILNPSPVQVSQVVATSTLVNGSTAGSHLFIYNQYFNTTYLSQLWGGEANFLMDGNPSELIQWLPLAGARYINLTENMEFNGGFLDLHNPTATVLNTTVQSHAINNLWGGQFGLRAQVLFKYLEFGATAKLLFLGDTVANTVAANNFTVTSGYVSYTDTTTKFTFGADVNGFVNINLTPSFTIRTGYTALWINQVSRPYKNVYYNDAGQATPISLQTVFHDIFINGFNFGCEFRF